MGERENHVLLNLKSGCLINSANDESICKDESNTLNENNMPLFLRDELKSLETDIIIRLSEKLSSNILNESLHESSKLLSKTDNNCQTQRSFGNVHLTENSSTSESCTGKREHIADKIGFNWKKKDFAMLTLTFIIAILKYLFYNYSLRAESLISLRKPLIESFFPNTSWITDFPDGNGASIDNLLLKSEIVVIYYYAPWSKHSITNRNAYANVGKLFTKYENIKFYAVNCYESKGECRKSFKLYNFPIITIFLNTKKYIQFVSDFTEENIFKWLSHILHPINRVNDKIQLDNYINRYRNVFLGFFSERSISLYEEFIYKSYKESEKEDSMENNKFLITTNSSLVNLFAGTNVTKSIIFYTSKNIFNNTVVKSFFLESVNSKESVLNDWITEKINNNDIPIRWIKLGNPLHPIKNNDLYKVLNSNDAVIHFSKKNSFKWQDTTSIDNFKKIAIKYYNSCFNKIKTYPKNVDTNDYETMCERNELPRLDVKSCCIELKSEKGFCSKNFTDINFDKKLNFCNKIKKFFSSEEVKKMCCRQSSYLINKKSGKKLSKDLICRYKKLHVHNYKYAYEKQYLSADVIPCNKNESLHFYLAPFKYLEYLKLIWNIPTVKSDQFTLLISKKDDAIYYEKNSKFDENVFLKMLQNYRDTEKVGVLTKKKVLTSKLPKNTDVNNVVSKLLMKDFLRITTFPTLKKNESDHVILLSGGPSNGPSMAVMHIFHQLANFFLPFNKLVKFSIVDVTKIDLPYPMKIDRIPGLYFQSSKTFENSAFYPKELPFTFPNIFAFIISRCQIELKWRIAITACTNKCFINNKSELKKYNDKISDFIRKSQILQNTNNVLGLEKMIEMKMIQRKLATELNEFLSELDNKDIVNFQQTIIKWVLYNFKT